MHRIVTPRPKCPCFVSSLPQVQPNSPKLLSNGVLGIFCSVLTIAGHWDPGKEFFVTQNILHFCSTFHQGSSTLPGRPSLEGSAGNPRWIWNWHHSFVSAWHSSSTLPYTSLFPDFFPVCQDKEADRIQFWSTITFLSTWTSFAARAVRSLWFHVSPELFLGAVGSGIYIFLLHNWEGCEETKKHFGLALLIINHQQILCKTSCFFSFLNS